MNYYPKPPDMPVRIVFEKVHPEAKAPTRASAGAAGWDVYTCEDCTVAGYVYGVQTGIKVQIPEGYEIQVRPRSSLSRNLTIVNSPGTIDSDYRGTIQILMRSNGELINIFKGERVAQLIIAPVPKVEFVEGVVVNNTERGEGGFGSTGR